MLEASFHIRLHLQFYTSLQLSFIFDHFVACEVYVGAEHNLRKEFGLLKLGDFKNRSIMKRT